jgi:hypothetical protein
MQRSESHKQLTLAKYIGLGLCAHMKTRSGADNECLGQLGTDICQSTRIHVYIIYFNDKCKSYTINKKHLPYQQQHMNLYTFGKFLLNNN